MDMYEAQTVGESQAFVKGHGAETDEDQATTPASDSQPTTDPTINVVNDNVADAAFHATVAQTHREKATVEELVVTGDNLFNKVKELIQQGGVRRIVIKTKRDKTLLEIPLTVGIVGGVVGVGVFPAMAVVTMLGAMLAQLKLVVERRPEAHP